MDTDEKSQEECAQDHPDLSGVEEILGYCFSDRQLLLTALTHSSYSPDKAGNNERLEFFGDAILDLIVCEYLYDLCDDAPEGELTEIKSDIVSRRTLGITGEALGISPYMRLGRGICSDREIPASILANAYEAIVASIYIDGGIEKAKAFILASLESEIKTAITRSGEKNFKSQLQEIVQKGGRESLQYVLLEESGPDHEKQFLMAATIDGVEKGRGKGGNKKEAEQNAAREAIKAIGEQNQTQEESADGEEE